MRNYFKSRLYVFVLISTCTAGSVGAQGIFDYEDAGLQRVFAAACGQLPGALRQCRPYSCSYTVLGTNFEHKVLGLDTAGKCRLDVTEGAGGHTCSLSVPSRYAFAQYRAFEIAGQITDISIVGRGDGTTAGTYIAGGRSFVEPLNEALSTKECTLKE